MLIQSCTLYKSSSVTLDEASKRASKVKITTSSDREYSFEKVKFENGEYYGYGNTNQGDYKIHLQENNIKKVQLKDNQKSNTRTYITLGAIGVTAAVLALSSIKAPVNKI